MRAIRLIIIGIIAAGLLSGCFTNKKSKCYPGGRCNHYQVYNRCGSTVKLECEDICRQCNSYEPQCYSCLACLESSPSACLDKTEKQCVKTPYNNGYCT